MFERILQYFFNEKPYFIMILNNLFVAKVSIKSSKNEYYPLNIYKSIHDYCSIDIYNLINS